MKKFIAFITLSLAMLSSAFAQSASCPNSLQYLQRNPADNGAFLYYACTYIGQDSIMIYDATVTQSLQHLKFGTGLSRSGDTLNVSGFATTSDLAGKFNIPAGTTAQYVRGDGSLATLPSSAPFNYGTPAAKTVAVSTAYQAADNTKAAVITVTPSCQNSTTLLASSACTLQLRQSASSGLSCSNGTVVSTWTSTVQLGLVFTQTSGSPFDVKLPSGGYFILCATAGTFTLSAVEQTAG